MYCIPEQAFPVCVFMDLIVEGDWVFFSPTQKQGLNFPVNDGFLIISIIVGFFGVLCDVEGLGSPKLTLLLFFLIFSPKMGSKKLKN